MEPTHSPLSFRTSMELTRLTHPLHLSLLTLAPFRSSLIIITTLRWRVYACKVHQAQREKPRMCVFFSGFLLRKPAILIMILIPLTSLNRMQPVNPEHRSLVAAMALFPSLQQQICQVNRTTFQAAQTFRPSKFLTTRMACINIMAAS